jgi:hypothetical protein
MTNPCLGHALLDLPAECGIRLEQPTASGGFCAEAICHIPRNSYMSRRLFARLIRRTNPVAVNGGLVYVKRGLEQQFNHETHTLVSHILLCTLRGCVWPQKGLNNVLEFIATSQSDGSGSDPTGGVPSYLASPHPSAEYDQVDEANRIPSSPSASDLWPDSKFSGALPLVDNLRKWYSRPKAALRVRDGLILVQDQSREKGHSEILTRLALIWRALLAALVRLRYYRRNLRTLVSLPLDAGNLHQNDLHRLVLAYTLIPLHDESHLLHPLLDSSPSLALHNPPIE